MSKEFYGLSQTDGRQPDWNLDLFSDGIIHSARRPRDMEHSTPASHLKCIYPPPICISKHPYLCTVEEY